MQIVNYRGPGCGDAWTPVAAGSTWIQGLAASYRSVVGCFINWRNGHIVAYGPRSRRNRIALDSPLLGVRLCRPIRRLANPEQVTSFESSDRWAPLAYDRPWAASVRGVGQVDDRFAASELVLQRCGRRAHVLDRARHRIGRVHLGGGWATWRRGRQSLRIYDLSARRLRRARIPSGTDYSGHTRRFVFVSRFVRPGTHVIYAAGI